MKQPALTGRKYSIARLCIGTGFIVCLAGIAAIAWKEATPGVHIANVVGSYASILMVSVSAFAAADATITSVAKWKDGPTQTQTKTETTSQVTVTGSASIPASPQTPTPVTVVPSADPLPVTVIHEEPQ